MRGLLLVGHGSHLDPNSSAPVYGHAKRLRERSGFDEIRVGFWKEEPQLSRALDGCEADDITVVPVFISGGYFTEEVIQREMGITGRIARKSGRTVRYAQPIGAHPSLAKVIIQRAEEVGARGTEALAVLGHGTPRNPNSEANVFQQAWYADRLGRFSEVVTVFLEQEPNMRDIFSLARNQDVVMVPLFIADGWHVGQTIPENLRQATKQSGGDGPRLRFGAAVGTHPGIADVIEELAEEASRW